MNSLRTKPAARVPGWAVLALLLGRLGAQEPAALRDRVVAFLDAPAEAPTRRSGVIELGVPAIPHLVEAALLMASDRDDRDRRERARSALAQLPETEVREAIVRRVHQRPDLSSRLAALELLGALASGSALPHLARILEGCPAPLRDGPPVSTAHGAAVRRIASRDPEGFERAVARQIHVTPPALQRDVLATLAERPHSRTASLLLNLLRSLEDPSPAIAALGLLPLAHLPADPRDWGPLADIAANGAIANRVAAWMLAARAGQADVTGWVGALEDPEARVRRGALAALHRATGQRFAAAPGRWLTWWEAERELWRTESEAWEEDLAGDDPAATFQALRSLERHPLVGRDLRERVADCTQREDPRLRLAALGTLLRLGAADQALRIAPLLDDPEPAVATTARRVLGEFLRPLKFTDAASVRALLR